MAENNHGEVNVPAGSVTIQPDNARDVKPFGAGSGPSAIGDTSYPKEIHSTSTVINKDGDIWIKVGIFGVLLLALVISDLRR